MKIESKHKNDKRKFLVRIKESFTMVSGCFWCALGSLLIMISITAFIQCIRLQSLSLYSIVVLILTVGFMGLVTGLLSLRTIFTSPAENGL